MTERLTGREKYSTGEIYEHVFPGNNFSDLSFFSVLGSIEVMGKTYLQAEMLRGARFAAAVEKGEEIIERENVSTISRVTASYFLDRLVPLAKATHPNYYNGRSFLDFLEDGEKLGGVASRELPWHPGALFLDGKLNLSKDLLYMPKPEIIIGILDKNGSPSAILHMVEGERVKITEKSTVPERFPSLFPVRY